LDSTVLGIFLVVYGGMILGRVPGLALDRTGVALLGAIALLATGKLTPSQAWGALDGSTLALLFGLMVVSAQLRLGGFYSELTGRLAAADIPPSRLLALLVLTAGLLSALLANDIVCLAMAPILVVGCSRRGLDPKPFLLALACAANVGSAATLIGNPQNMLIGQTLHLSFGGYLLDAVPPALCGLVAVWWVVCRQVGSDWLRGTVVAEPSAPPFDRWQSGKGVLVVFLLTAAFLFAPWPREVLALAAAGILLCSRRMRSGNILALVDWHLLILFIGLFVVNHALATSGILGGGFALLQRAGIDLARPAWLFALTVPLSNLVSNVPAVMILLPAADHPLAGAVLALGSTLAGNFLVVGSIANIIVIDQAARLGVAISWREHLRVGVPVTLITLGMAALWLWLRWQSVS